MKISKDVKRFVSLFSFILASLWIKEVLFNGEIASARQAKENAAPRDVHGGKYAQDHDDVTHEHLKSDSTEVNNTTLENLADLEGDDPEVKCSRKDHIVYIKTHKTGSTTFCSLFWRLSLRRNLNLVAFDSIFPFPNPSFIGSMLDRHPSLHKLSHIDMASEHMMYNRREFEQIMPNDSFYLSSLREPFSQFKSIVNYFFPILKQKYNISRENPVSELLENMDKHFSGHGWTHNILRNRNSRMLGLNPEDFENMEVIRAFLKRIREEFEHMLISEYPDESLIVMRRKLCWDFSDILYLPLNVKKYNYKKVDMENHLKQKLMNWSQADAMLHQMFNDSLWSDVSVYGVDFKHELDFYRHQTNRIYEFCSPVVNAALHDPEQVKSMLGSKDQLVIPNSPWGKEYSIDYVWCLLSKINLMAFKNIIRVRQYPELCENITSESKFLSYNKFSKYFNSAEVNMNPVFCSRNLTPVTSTYQVPVEVLLEPAVYTTGF